MSRERIVYDFCPRCGALMKNGVCTSCGYDGTSSWQEQQASAGQSSPDWQEQTDTEFQNVSKNKHTGLIVGLCVGAAVITCLLFVAVILIVGGAKDMLSQNGGIFQAISGETAGDDAEIWDQWQDDADASGEYTVFDNKNSSYKPSSSDDFYLEIVDAVNENLSYQVVWEEFDVANEEEQISSCGVYPQLTGDVPNLDALNKWIEEEVLYYKNALEEYGMQPDHASVSTETACYITYMDENIISIVLQERVIMDGYSAPEIHAINIDVKNGVLLENSELLEYSLQLAQRVKKQNLYQNSGAEYISDLDDETVLELLAGYEGVIFYTPVGIEIGFNYELDGYVGWVTVTLKDYADFGNKF